MLKKVLLVLVLSFSLSLASSRIVTEVNYTKIINGDHGLEFLAKFSWSPVPGVTIKGGLSETYTGYRAASLLSLNHDLIRKDLGVYWEIAEGLEVGYTHSTREPFDGADPRTVYIHDSMDTFSVRKEFNI